MIKTSIEWTEMSWNPTTGCDKISAGCKFCYAAGLSKKNQSEGSEKYKDGFKLRLHPSSLTEPYFMEDPSIIFVNSMSDLFHKDVPISFIRQVFKVMNDNPRHIFQVLTKRSDILRKYDEEGLLNWTPNIWMCVSIEDEKVVHRIDDLRATSAHVKFLSCEPLIGPLYDLNLEGIHQVIAGGESGPICRPMKESWVLDIKDQCEKSEVPFFFKQWGGSNKKAAGRLLKGKTYDAMPKAYEDHKKKLLVV